MKDNKVEIECKHGKGIASVICCHQLNSVDPVGFIENSSDPDDLQAWCYACEYLFQQEGDKTERFNRFSNSRIVCEQCYEKFRSLHSVE
jgi:hypothetical protein